MGALENQLRENETFESLLELYLDARNEKSALRERVAELESAAKQYMRVSECPMSSTSLHQATTRLTEALGNE